jgi:alpha-1,6-mannosyltransferase
MAYVQAARAGGIALAAVVSIAIVLRSRLGPLEALGWSLLTFVVLGPVVWPWYETWGFVFLAVVAEAWTLRLLLALSATACFADLPSVRYFETTEPVLAVVCWVLLAGMILAYGALRIVPSVRCPPGFVPSPSASAPVPTPPGQRSGGASTRPRAGPGG